MNAPPSMIPASCLLLIPWLPPAPGAEESGRAAAAAGPAGSEVVLLPDPATPARCASRRARVAAARPDALLVIESGEEPNDGRFQPHDDFHWLTGLSAPEAALFLRTEEGRLAEVVLYLPAEDPVYELWNGPRLGPGEEAVERTGIDDTRAVDGLLADLGAALERSGASEVYAAGEGVVAFLEERGVKVRSPAHALQALQAVKDAEELAAQRAAIDITQAALVEALREALPGSFEFQAEATIEAGFRRRGAEDLAFPSICGSGPNSCYLHYRANQRRLEDGDLMVIDVGAKFRHYCADVTRTIPVSGRFTERQREVYGLVYEASRRAAAVLKPGATLAEAHDVAAKFLEEHGFGKKHFPHSVGHGLGLRVHDGPQRGTVLEPGMVVTIEPGIYIVEEALGVRIEDDYLIHADGAELLSDDVPSRPDELEAFLAEIRGNR